MFTEINTPFLNFDGRLWLKEMFSQKLVEGCRVPVKRDSRSIDEARSQLPKLYIISCIYKVIHTYKTHSEENGG